MTSISKGKNYLLNKTLSSRLVFIKKGGKFLKLIYFFSNVIGRLLSKFKLILEPNIISTSFKINF